MNTSFMRSTLDKMLTEISCENCYYPEKLEYSLDEYQRDRNFYESSSQLNPVIEFCNGKAVWTKKLVKTVPQVRPFVKTVPALKSNNILIMQVTKFLRSNGYKPATTAASSETQTLSESTEESKKDSTEISMKKLPSLLVITLKEEEETSAARPNINGRESKYLLNNPSEAKQGHCRLCEKGNCQKEDNCICCSKEKTASADSKKGPLKSSLKNTKTNSTKKPEKKVSINIFVEGLTEGKELITQKLNYICGIPKDETSLKSGAPSKAYVPPHLRRETGGNSMQTQIQGNVEKSENLLKRSSEEKRVSCRYYEKGCCQYGDTCRYYHSPVQKMGSRSSYHFGKNEGQRRISNNKGTSNRFR